MSLLDSAMRALNTAGMTELETTCFKATYPDENRSKEKHVESMIRMTDHYRPDVIVRLLGSRAREREWYVVLKALGVAHRLLREGNIRFFQACATFPIFSGMGQYLDESSTAAWGQTRFIREYAAYLESKCDVLKTVGKSVELLPAKDGGEWVRKLPFLKLREVLPKLQSQFDRLIKCSPFTDEGGLHEVAILPMLQLIKDGFRLYSVLTISVFQQLNRWQSMQKREGLFFLDCYEKFAKQTALFKQWANKMVKLNLVDKEVLPEFDNLPENLIPTLDAYFRKNFKGPADTPDEEEAEAAEDADETETVEEDEEVEEEEEEEEEQPPPRRPAAARQASSNSQPGRPAAAAAAAARPASAAARRSPTASVAAAAAAGAAGPAPVKKAAAAAKPVAAAAKPAAKAAKKVQPPTEAFDLLDLSDTPAPAPARKPAAAAKAAAKPAAAAKAPARRPVVQQPSESEESEYEEIEVEEEVEEEEEETPQPPPRSVKRPVAAAAAAKPAAKQSAASSLDDLFTAQPAAAARKPKARAPVVEEEEEVEEVEEVVPAPGARRKAAAAASTTSKKADPFADLHFDDDAAAPPPLSATAVRKTKAKQPAVDPFDFR